MINKFVQIAVISLGTASFAPAMAAPITYNVDLNIGAGSVVGNIVTDGMLGALSSSNIIGFNLTLNGVGASTNIFSPSAVAVVVGADLTATSSSLSFNFSGTDDGYLLFQQNLMSGMQYFCSATTTDTCFQGESVVPESYRDPSAQFVPVLGEQVIGTVSAVPLPASAPMFGAALLALGVVGFGWKRKAAVT